MDQPLDSSLQVHEFADTLLKFISCCLKDLSPLMQEQAGDTHVTIESRIRYQMCEDATLTTILMAHFPTEVTSPSGNIYKTQTADSSFAAAVVGKVLDKDGPQKIFQRVPTSSLSRKPERGPYCMTLALMVTYLLKFYIYMELLDMTFSGDCELSRQIHNIGAAMRSHSTHLINVMDQNPGLKFLVTSVMSEFWMGSIDDTLNYMTNSNHETHMNLFKAFSDYYRLPFNIEKAAIVSKPSSGNANTSDSPLKQQSTSNQRQGANADTRASHSMQPATSTRANSVNDIDGVKGLDDVDSDFGVDI